MNDAPRGVLVVLAGTSGAGKGTIGERLRARYPELAWSVSWTTRAPRAGERDGVDYHFVTRDEFERRRAVDGFLESFDVYGALYGTPREAVVEQLAAGRDVLLEIDVQGALEVKRRMPEALLVFVRTPSRAEQRRRLEARGTDPPEAIERRLARAAAEEAIGDREFDRVVVNDDLERAVDEVAGILALRRNSASDPPAAGRPGA